MADAADLDIAMRSGRTRHLLIYRHSRIVRLCHWINAVAFLWLAMTGLIMAENQPQFAWGNVVSPMTTSSFTIPVFVPWYHGQDYGVNSVSFGPAIDRFLNWLNPYLGQQGIPYQHHMMMAWILVLNGGVYISHGFLSGRFAALMRPSRRDWDMRAIWYDLRRHVTLQFPKGDEARRYNFLQKYAYLAVIFVAFPAMWLTGLAQSPPIQTALPWLSPLLGGRQSARILHFGVALTLLAFFVVHLVMVLASGFFNNVRSMITGWYRLPE